MPDKFLWITFWCIAVLFIVAAGCTAYDSNDKKNRQDNRCYELGGIPDRPDGDFVCKYKEETK